MKKFNAILVGIVLMATVGTTLASEAPVKNQNERPKHYSEWLAR